MSTATNKAARPVKVAAYPFAIVMTPDGKTAYVLSENSELTPITTATNTVGARSRYDRPGYERLAATPAITPDGKTIYVSPSVRK